MPKAAQRLSRTLLFGLIAVPTFAQHMGASNAGGSVIGAAPPPAWAKDLRNCPCNAPGVGLNDGWALLPSIVPNTTNDSVSCYRSYLMPNDKPTRAGQNCCYDRTGQFYNQGTLVGLPDKVGTCIGEELDGSVILAPAMVYAHQQEDLLPREAALRLTNGWLERQKEHPPNRGQRCKTNGILPVIPETRSRGFQPYVRP